MKTTKVYINDSLVVLYGEWPEQPNYCQAYTAEDRYCVLCSTGKGCEGEKTKYKQALNKAIAEAVPFEDQDGVKRLLLKALNWNPHPDEHRFEPNTFYDIQAEVEVDPNKKLAVIKPLSSGEKEEQCPKCRTKDFASCHSMYCPMRKPSPVDTNIEEKKIFAPDKEHFDKMLLKELVWKLDREVWAHVPNPTPSEEWTTSKARERTRELIAEYIGDYDKLAAKSTPPVQEKPDFSEASRSLYLSTTDNLSIEQIMVKSMEYIWKNYVELETSRAEGWRKQYYDWKDLLLTTEEENRKLKQEIQHLKQPLQPVKSLQEIKDEVAKKYDLDSYLDANVYNRANELADEVAELYASQFKTPPVLQFNNKGPLANPINAKYEVINQDEMLDNLIYEIENLLSQMDYEKIISHLKSKYTIIPKQ